ncbi:hypothetical protein ACIP93_14895 [Streptomyces sp. NPDC088745]|uniref:hypothetical protein n=1 Tax=Streptomyces sp. NPDC088745 TaxID=3365884 RepID=UPI00381C76EE
MGVTGSPTDIRQGAASRTKGGDGASAPRPDGTLSGHRRVRVPVRRPTGRGDGHVRHPLAAHRAVGEADTGPGLAEAVALACAQGVGEAPAPSSAPAVPAAIRAAAGLEPNRVLARPEHLTGT